METFEQGKRAATEGQIAADCPYPAELVVSDKPKRRWYQFSLKKGGSDLIGVKGLKCRLPAH